MSENPAFSLHSFVQGSFLLTLKNYHDDKV